jgi:hypothetical protein
VLRGRLFADHTSRRWIIALTDCCTIALLCWLQVFLCCFALSCVLA